MMALSLCSVAAMATGYWSHPDFKYNITGESTVEITRYTGSGGAVTVPGSVSWMETDSEGNIVNVQNYTVTAIKSAFSGWESLTSITIPNTVTTIEEWAFRGCTGLTSVTIPNSVTTIGEYAFSGCAGLTSVSIGNSVTAIGGYAFFRCTGLTSVTIPNSVTTIEEGAFAECSGLTSVTIGNSVTSIGGHAFDSCNGLTSVTIGNSVTTIGAWAFAYCDNLTSVAIPNSVTSIGGHAFESCSGLTSVTIPNSVTTIGVQAFAFCNSLADVYVDWATPLSIPDNVFLSANVSACTLHVPAGTEASYQSAGVWRDFHISGSATLTVSPATANIAASGGTASITVTSNVSWTASSSASWATVSPLSGSNNGTVTVTAAANSGAARTATITFSGGGVTSQTVTITQAAGTPASTLTVSPATANIAASGGTASITVTSNISWSASSSASWATVSPSSGSNNGTVTVTASANSGAARTATITISGGGITRTVSVTQEEEEQEVVVEAVPPTDDTQSYLILRLGIPTDDPFSGTFLVLLPPGMSLDRVNTVLLGSLVNRYDLLIAQIAANTWSVEIRPKTSPRTLSATAYRDIVKLAYTIDETVTYGPYEIVISDLEVTLDDETVIREDEIRVEVIVDPTGNESIEAASAVWYYGGLLSVRTPAIESVTVYSLSGVAVFRAEKDAGLATYRLNDLPRGVYVVKGGSGWTGKIVVSG
jgi:hypothetical protein